MNTTVINDIHALPLPAELRVDEICLRFEAVWKTGRRPRIDDYVGATEGNERLTLLRELILLDVYYRRSLQEFPRPEEYLHRFPEMEPTWSADIFGTTGAGHTTPGDAPLGEPPGDADTGRTALGRFVVEGEIGRGGMGCVFRGRDPDLDRTLAIKILLPRHGGQEAMRQRFLEEARIAGRLEHPGIPAVHELGRAADGRPFFVMKLIRGHTLAELLSERPDPVHDLPRFLGIFEQVCQTVAYAHAHGVVHRDLKPANVMVGQFGEVQVMDWGLAKRMVDSRLPTADGQNTNSESSVDNLPSAVGNPPATEAGRILGTPAYMAPEQARGQIDHLDERTDVFGLGAILCEILTGTPPFARGEKSVLVRQAARGDVGEALGRLAGCGADAELVGLATACLAAKGCDRPRGAGEVAERVTAYRTDVDQRLRQAEMDRAAAQARAEAAAAKARAERRARRLTIGLATAVLLLVATGGGTAWYWRQHSLEQAATASQRQAEQARREAERALEVDRSLTEVTDHQRGQRWDRAWAALERAQGRLAGSTDSALRHRVEQIRRELEQYRRDQETLVRLEDAQLQRASPARDDHETALLAELYRKTFADYGLDLDKLTTAEAAQRVAGSRIAEALIVALDDYRQALPRQGTAAARLRAIADRADRNPWRRRLRAAIVADDHSAIRRLAAGPIPSALGSSTVIALADGLRQTGAPGQALAMLRAAQRRQPHDFWLCYKLAVHSKLQGPAGSGEALRYFSVAISLRPRNALIYHNLGVVLREQHRLAESAAAHADAVRLQPDLAAAHSGLGDTLVLQGKFDEAIASYRKAIRLQPDFAVAHNNLGNVLLSQKKFQEAMAAYRKAIRFQPEFPSAHFNMGNVYAAQGKLSEAVAAYGKAIRFQGDYAPAHLALGTVLQSQGKLPEAVAAYQVAIRLQPNFALAHHNLGVTRMAQGKPAEAVAAYQQALHFQPNIAETHDALGSAFFRLQKYSEAVVAFWQAVRLKPDFAAAHCNLGNALYRQGKATEAVAACRTAIQHAPNLALAHALLGLSLRELGKFAEALPCLQRAQQLGAVQPGWPTAVIQGVIRQIERPAALDHDLPAFLSGKRQAAGAAEQIELAQLCAHRGRRWYGASARFYAAAFANKAALANDLVVGQRYAAACAATLAGCGRSDDRPPPDGKQRSALRKQALRWLRQDLAAWSMRMDGGKPNRVLIRAKVGHWTQDADLGGVRNPDALAKLPADEQKAWQRLWADVAELLQKAARN